MVSLFTAHVVNPSRVLTRDDKAKLYREAMRQARERGGKTTGLEKVTEAQILAIWNDIEGATKFPELAEFISKMSASEKVAIAKAALMKNLPEWFKTGWKTFIDLKHPSTPIDVKQIYAKIIEDEITARGLFSKKVITEELKKASFEQRPVKPEAFADPKYMKYRMKPEELYADAFSMLMTNPTRLQEVAPSFFAAFHNYLAQKIDPVSNVSVKDAYDALQETLANQALTLKQRMDGLYEMWRGDDIRRAEMRAREAQKISLLRDTLANALFDDKHGVLGPVRKGAKSSDPAVRAVDRGERRPGSFLVSGNHGRFESLVRRSQGYGYPGWRKLGGILASRCPPRRGHGPCGSLP